MLNELYTFAEPVQVVPFSNLKWGKFTLLHTTASAKLNTLVFIRLPYKIVNLIKFFCFTCAETEDTLYTHLKL